jgi:hypothetical protein
LAAGEIDEGLPFRPLNLDLSGVPSTIKDLGKLCRALAQVFHLLIDRNFLTPGKIGCGRRPPSEIPHSGDCAKESWVARPAPDRLIQLFS